ncbi:MAG: MvaI/BcnI family restriction endonuclease, partial [Candidatus Zixiibacteriota bacterium]
KTIGGIEHFHFTNAKVYIHLRFDSFVAALKSGKVMFDIRIGINRTVGRPDYGKPHDHGSGFRVRRENLHELFDEVLDIK